MNLNLGHENKMIYEFICLVSVGCFNISVPVCASAPMCVFINLLPPSLPYVSRVPGASHWATSHTHALTSQDMTPNTHEIRTGKTNEQHDESAMKVRVYKRKTITSCLKNNEQCC